MLGPEGVATALVAHAIKLVPEGLAMVRAQRALSLANLPEFRQILGYEPVMKTHGMFPLLCFTVEDTTGRLDTRRIIDGAEGDIFIRTYRTRARVYISGPSEVETTQAMHRYALAVRDGLQLQRGVVDTVPASDTLEITTRQTTENYQDAAEVQGRFVASASFTFYLRAEEFLPAIQNKGGAPVVGGVNINTGAAAAGRDLQGDLVEGGVSSASPLIERKTLG